MKDKLLVIICRCMEATERIHSEFLECNQRDIELNTLANETTDKILQTLRIKKKK